MTLTNQQIKMMQEEMYARLVELLISRRGIPMERAISLFYNSDTYDLLSDRNTGLYYQSAGYVYTYLDEEISRKSVCNSPSAPTF